MNQNIRMSVAACLLAEGITGGIVNRETLLRLFGSRDQIAKNKTLSEQGVIEGKYIGTPCVFAKDHPVAYPQWLWVTYKVFGKRAQYDITPLMQELQMFIRKLEESKKTPVAN